MRRMHYSYNGPAKSADCRLDARRVRRGVMTERERGRGTRAKPITPNTGDLVDSQPRVAVRRRSANSGLTLAAWAVALIVTALEAVYERLAGDPDGELALADAGGRRE
jgi:hypothetical protein